MDTLGGLMKKLFLFSLLVVSFSGFADEIEDAIKQASELYKKGNTQQAVTQLEYASQLIREKRGSALAQYLPDALPGWEAEEADTESAGAAMFGGGTFVSREYCNAEDVCIKATITADSPLLQSMLMMLSNPMMMQGQGMKMKLIKGQQVMFNQDGAMAVVNNRYLVQIEAQNDAKILDPNVVAYTEAVDFQGIADYK